ncbi:helix-turn-helix transcriptional regulator [Streptomyces sp. NPDC090301]|uniref:helix-turn-helix domain-containing protein n=1 Tax=Streptomyces sp. NPDC090301 TaxID=3154975 RepID=UPI0034427DFB
MLTVRPVRVPSVEAYLNAPGRKSPTALNTVLSYRLRELRDTAGMKPSVAARSLRCSPPKLSRLERGLGRLYPSDVERMLDLYQAPESPDQFLQLVKHANEPGWWAQHKRVVPKWFDRFIGLQEASTWIRTYEYQLVPGLLQTPEYAREVIKRAYLFAPPSEVERRLRLRMERQELLFFPRGPRLLAVLHEAVLRTEVGGRDVMRRQLEYLEHVSRCGTITLQILPFVVNGALALGSPMTLLRFDNYQLPDIVYIERGTDAEYIEEQEDSQTFSAQMSQLTLQAASIERSREMLQEAIIGLS